MNKKISLGVTICAIFVAVAITFSVTWQISESVINKSLSSTENADDISDKLSEIEEKLNEVFLYNIDDKEIVNSVADGYIKSLGDKYAEYYTPEQFQEKQLEESGNLIGIGVTISDTSSGYCVITDVYDDSSAANAGISIGDYIIKINGEDVYSKTSSDIKDGILGAEGENVSITIRHDSTDSTYDLIRKKIEITTVSGEMLDGNIGYIRIKAFRENTYDQFKAILDELLKNGAKALMFDMRNNGGGRVDSVVKVLDALLPEGTILTSVDKNGKEVIEGTSDAEHFVDLPMVVIANENTASAAEIFSCDLRDFGKCKIVGTTTKGKGVMQQTYRLSDGSAIKVTTAYYNPSVSANYDGIGLAPDYECSLSSEQTLLLYSLDRSKDAQFAKALEVIKTMIS